MRNSFIFHPIVEKMIFEFWESKDSIIFIITLIICFSTSIISQFLKYLLTIKIIKTKFKDRL
jgi:hypothetical protein